MSKHSIVLFSREELTYLNGYLHHSLSEKYEVINLAYSDTERDILISKYKIQDIIVLQHEIERELKEVEITVDLLNEIDKLIISSTNDRFCLNSTIQNDRTFSVLTYHETQLLVIAYYKFWKRLIAKYRPCLIFHEPTSLFFNHIASILIRNFNGYYCSPIMVSSNKIHSFILLKDDSAISMFLEKYYNLITKDDIALNKKEIDQFVNGFTKNFEVYLGNIIKNKASMLRLLARSIKFYVNRNSIKDIPISKSVDKWRLSHNKSWFLFKNRVFLKLFIKYDQIDENDTFYYYSIHYEPEAVVLYWGDGIYKGQIKLIENIAAQLPPNTLLYVKDHPHFHGYRDYKDYMKLQTIPNVKLLSPSITGKYLVSKSKGVITINGTAGLEGIFFKKPVYTFGNAFYSISPFVKYVHNIRNLRKQIYHDYFEGHEEDSDEFDRFVLAYLQSTAEGVTDYFMSRISKYQINEMENAKKISTHIENYISSFCQND